MNVKNGQNKPAASRGDSSDIRVVAIDLKPGPDTPDRLRRLFTLLVTCVARDGSFRPGRTHRRRTARSGRLTPSPRSLTVLGLG